MIPSFFVDLHKSDANWAGGGGGGGNHNKHFNNLHPGDVPDHSKVGLECDTYGKLHSKQEL